MALEEVFDDLSGVVRMSAIDEAIADVEFLLNLQRIREVRALAISITRTNNDAATESCNE